MALVSGKKILEHARKNNYAVPAFGYVNLEGAKAIIEASEEMNTPVILQTTGGGISYGGHEQLVVIGKSLAEKAKVPVTLHLDHGKNLEIVKKSIELGYTSVMYDGSEQDLEVNINNSLEVLKMIGNKDISIETELGLIGGKEDDMENEATAYTSVEDSNSFVSKVHPDALAIVCGTAHGKYFKKVDVQFKLIEDTVKSMPNTTIVLHGASWVPEADVTKAVEAGITKVNFDSELKQAFINSVMNYMKDHKNDYDIRKIFRPAIDAQKEVCFKKIKACKSDNKNWL